MLEELWPELGKAWVTGVLAGGGSILVQWLAPKTAQALRRLRATKQPRLEALAPPGGICISDDAWRYVRGAVAAEFVDLGEQRLKNIADPAHWIAGPRRA